jgi:NADH dehydrogenase
MHKSDTIITVIGGTGFLGRYVVRELARQGYRLRVVARHAEDGLELKTAGNLGQIAVVSGNLAQIDSIRPHLEGAFAVVNLVGLLFERGRQKFSALHAQGPEKLAQAAKAEDVAHFVQMSALGVDRANAQYARTKMLGEKAVRAAFPEAVILRPGVVFGPEDRFFNQFAQMAMAARALPLIGGGKTKFQPVYAGDVAQAVRAAIENPACAGKTYELGGPEAYTFRQILEYILKVTGRKACLIPLPFPLAAIGGAFAEFLPRPPLTRDQVRLLHYDNVVAPDAQGFRELGIQPTAVEMLVPDYLARFRKGGR